MTRNRHKSDSGEQSEAECSLLAKLGELMDIAALCKRRVEGLELDGFAESEDRIVLAEAYAHIGPLEPGHRKKVDSDFLKLLFCKTKLQEKGEQRRIECYLVFADSIAKTAYDAGWRSAALKRFEVQTICAQLGSIQRSNVLQAQARQRMTNA